MTAASATGERVEVVISRINDRITRFPRQLARQIVWLNVQWSDLYSWARQTSSISARSQTGRLDNKGNLLAGHYCNSGWITTSHCARKWKAVVNLSKQVDTQTTNLMANEFTTSLYINRKLPLEQWSQTEGTDPKHYILTSRNDVATFSKRLFYL